MTIKNKHNVQVGQVWKDNDQRLAQREFKITQVDLDYYPGGRARCRREGPVKKGQRLEFWARLDRFNGTKRGYSLVKNAGGSPAQKSKKKGKKGKKGKKKARRKE